MREFGIERMNMTPVSGIKHKWLHEYPTLDKLIADRSHLVPVAVDENGETEISDFDHPDNALYVCGRVSESCLARFDGPSVRIDTPTNEGMLWPHQALAIVLLDRFRK